MATRKIPKPDASDHHLVPVSSLEAQVKNAVSELSSSTETLRGLASALDNYGGTNARSDANALRQAAIGIRASAVQTLLTACTVVGLSERLATFGRILEAGEATQER
jgi:hypothetical protein